MVGVITFYYNHYIFLKLLVIRKINTIRVIVLDFFFLLCITYILKLKIIKHKNANFTRNMILKAKLFSKLYIFIIMFIINEKFRMTF